MDITTLAAAKTYTNNKVEEIINGGDVFVVDPTLSLSGAAADAKITGDRLALLENYVTPQMFGAKADGKTDDTQAIQSMFDKVAGVKKVYFPTGNYMTTAPIIVEQVPDIEMDGVILSNHDGVALTLGNSNKNAIDKTIRLKVKSKKNTTEDFAEGSVGVFIQGISRSTFYLDVVSCFETNVIIYSRTKSVLYNNFYITNLAYAKYGLYLDGGTNGVINENLFVGGVIGKTSDGAGITVIKGGSNVFWKQTLEGKGTSVHVISGGTNTFLQSRCENSTYGLVVDEGSNNVMYANYGKPQFVNNSQYSTNGIVTPGIHNKCKYSAVSVDKLEDDRFLICGAKVIPTYCQVINATSGNVIEIFNSDSFHYENGVWTAGTYAPVFVFDTTKNKRFEFTVDTGVQVNAYDANGRITLTNENVGKYVLADRAVPSKVSEPYGGGARLDGSTFLGFEVSEEVVKIELVYLGGDAGIAGVTGFNIRTEYPCYPIRDEILTVPSIPENGYLGARILYNSDLYVYNGIEWKREDYTLTDEDKTEIAEQAASLIDTVLLSALGSGVIE